MLNRLKGLKPFASMNSCLRVLYISHIWLIKRLWADGKVEECGQTDSGGRTSWTGCLRGRRTRWGWKWMAIMMKLPNHLMPVWRIWPLFFYYYYFIFQLRSFYWIAQWSSLNSGWVVMFSCAIISCAFQPKQSLSFRTSQMVISLMTQSWLFEICCNMIFWSLVLCQSW